MVVNGPEPLDCGSPPKPKTGPESSRSVLSPLWPAKMPEWLSLVKAKKEIFPLPSMDGKPKNRNGPDVSAIVINHLGWIPRGLPRLLLSFAPGELAR